MLADCTSRAGCSAALAARGRTGLRATRGPNAGRVPRPASDPAEPASFADLPWWDVFGDPALQRLVQEALAEQLRSQDRDRPRRAVPRAGRRRRIRSLSAGGIPGDRRARARRSWRDRPRRASRERPSTCSRAPSTSRGRSTSGAASAAPRKRRARSFSRARRLVAASW